MPMLIINLLSQNGVKLKDRSAFIWEFLKAAAGISILMYFEDLVWVLPLSIPGLRISLFVILLFLSQFQHGLTLRKT